MGTMTDLRMQTAIDHLASLVGVNVVEAWGETSFFYNPDDRFARGTYFATIKDKDGEHDRGSQLDREGVWRLSMGVRSQTFETLFGRRPARPANGKAVEGPWDFARLDTLMPHPTYAWMGWVAILSPSAASWAKCKPQTEDAHRRAVATFEKRARS